MIQYIVRLDDASPRMVEDSWKKIYQILKGNGIMPLVGVIPHNEDPTQQNPVMKDFWGMMRQWQADGVTIALHGYNHCYISKNVGINPLWNRSEFAGVPYEVQKQKISDGYTILKEQELNPQVFFAPSHTYDEITLECLKEFTPIRVISDTMAIKPYKEGEFTFVPQQFGHFVNLKLPGTWTFCFHPNTMTDEDVKAFERFIKENRKKFISFRELELKNLRKKGLISRVMSWAYFFIRTIRAEKKKI